MQSSTSKAQCQVGLTSAIGARRGVRVRDWQLRRAGRSTCRFTCVASKLTRNTKVGGLTLTSPAAASWRLGQGSSTQAPQMAGMRGGMGIRYNCCTAQADQGHTNHAATVSPQTKRGVRKPGRGSLPGPCRQAHTPRANTQTAHMLPSKPLAALASPPPQRSRNHPATSVRGLDCSLSQQE